MSSTASVKSRINLIPKAIKSLLRSDEFYNLVMSRTLKFSLTMKLKSDSWRLSEREFMILINFYEISKQNKRAKEATME